ncbi:MAG: accessory Sec system protein Asp1 [Lachnospiraceae bacterium]|nr:accessory Sec system protein Asp1 [Lachnospiraceae bacterium]
MVVFIPAWFKNNEWCENEQNWHERKMHSEFDDSVKQIQLFHRNKAFDYSICILGFSPNLRHFLHRQGVYMAPYFSVFDAINECESKRARVFSYKDLSWIPNTEFIYTPFVAIALFQGRKYAQLEFGEDGNLIQVDMYEGDNVAIRSIYDDRGFVSSAIIYDETAPVYQDYYNENGTWKIRVFFEDGHVEINKERNFYVLGSGDDKREITFKKLQYESLEEVISEIFNSYIDTLSSDDIFCVAMHNLITGLVAKSLKGKKTILSFFEKRFSFDDEYTKQVMQNANYIITDSKIRADEIMDKYESEKDKVVNITPYDTRRENGISQQLTVQKILLAVDSLSPESFEKLVLMFAEYFDENDKARVYFFTREADYNLPNDLLNRAGKILSDNGFSSELALGTLDDNVSENGIDDIDGMEEVPVKFFVEQCVDELSASKCIMEQRLIINMSNASNLYLQISGVSFGIPQIVTEETQYVKDGLNGQVVRNIEDLPKTLRFYLSGMKNWNNAMIHAYDIGENYTTRRLVEKWKEVVDNIG